MMWTKGVRCAAVLSFDVDGEAGMLQADPKNSDRISVMSWACRSFCFSTRPAWWRRSW